MPQFKVREQIYDLPRNIALVDTNVLVAFADDSDGLHEQASASLDLAGYVWVVAYPVIIEAWNLLVGKRGKTEKALYLMRWLLTPGSVIIINDTLEGLPEISDHTGKFDIDIVDATLMKRKRCSDPTLLMLV